MFIKRGATSGDNPKIFRNFIPHEFIRLTKPSEMRIFIQAVFTLVLMVAVLHNFTVSSRNKWISCCHTVLLECQRSLFFIYIFRGFLMHCCTLSILSLSDEFHGKNNNGSRLKSFSGQKRRTEQVVIRTNSIAFLFPLRGYAARFPVCYFSLHVSTNSQAHVCRYTLSVFCFSKTNNVW